MPKIGILRINGHPEVPDVTETFRVSYSFTGIGVCKLEDVSGRLNLSHWLAKHNRDQDLMARKNNIMSAFSM
ncbi:hypothetical protein NPIL_186071 [Nephila pilipes]|uniref:Uncharacterized protein n=1 Tax=Nephila pilipes TaxID=299642 RepID=A0A8X6MNF8_NEPPI|nr:hypothetical protein NPIL_186071 [Nephila pilipes]